MVENYGFSDDVVVTKRKLDDVSTMICEIQTAFFEGVCECLGVEYGDYYKVISNKQKIELIEKKNKHVISAMLVPGVSKGDNLIDIVRRWGYNSAISVDRYNRSLFDDTRHTPDAPATHLVCYRAGDGTIGIVEQFASFTEAQGFINDMGYGFIVEL